MKKLVLFFFLVTFLVFSEEVEVKIKATIYKPLTIEKLSDLDFGDVVVGTNNIKAIVPAQIKVMGSGEVRLTWKDINGTEEYQLITSELSLPIRNIKSPEHIIYTKLKARNVELQDSINLIENEGKNIYIDGVIPQVNRDALVGNYEGTMIIRAEYVN